uniref:Phage virion morphogenesis (Putative tail completion) protein n=1 Tax=Candidatus Kentrum sp. LFY TaxID=2126342 RepID=A0A450WXI6_9GAMM|nr:MAG: phage virion morphogenesis (putative tail completion) protein [Candidatus Kentron sp. LFY]
MSEIFKGVLIGDEKFQQTMDGITRFAKRPRLAMRDMSAVLEEQTEENFKDQGRPKWKPLSEITIRARLGGDKAHTKKGKLRKQAKRELEQMKILQVRGLLAGSVHSQYGDDYSMIGAATPYARIHQLGGMAGRNLKVEIPARPYLPFSKDLKLQPEARNQLLKTGMKHLQRAAN